MNTSVYNNLLTTIDLKPVTKQVHDARELRSVTKRIRKQTQSSPVYLVDFTNEKQSFVLGIKEAAMKMNDSLQVLADDSRDALFQKKKAHSSDVEQVGVELTDPDKEHLPSAFTIRTKQLANTQINQGKEFYETGKGLSAGTYQFKITVNDVGYDFQYNIRKDANHREVIQGLSNFITKAKIGIVAEPYAHEDGKIGMRLESTSVGTPDGRESFRLEDKTTDSSGRGIVEYYGLNNIAVAPKNAIFDLNGVEKTSMANEFTLERAVRVSLRKPSETEAVIDYHADSEVILGGIKAFISDYNELVGKEISFERKTEVSTGLQKELQNMIGPARNQLEACGITFDKDGYMQLDTALASEAIESGEMKELFGKDSALTNRIFAKTEAIKINPMEYIDKKIVSYPNFQKPPRGYSYITSLYSGLLFNYYC